MDDPFGFSDPGVSFGDFPIGYGSPSSGMSGMSLQNLIDVPINAPGMGIEAPSATWQPTAPSGVDLSYLDPTSDDALGGKNIFPSFGGANVGGAAPPLDLGTGATYSLGDLPGQVSNIGAMVNQNYGGGPSTTIDDNGVRTLFDPGASLPLGSTPTSSGNPFNFGGAPGGAKGDAGKGGSFWDSLVSGLGSSLGKSLPGAAVAAGGLAYNALNKSNDPSKDPNYAAMAAQAQGLNAQGQQLASYLASGTLPAGLQAAVNKAKSDAKTAIISRYAAQGLPTDPSKNSQLAAELANADLLATIQIAQIGQQLLQSGQSASQLSATLYSKLLEADQKRSDSMGKAVSNFAAALSGGGGKSA